MPDFIPGVYNDCDRWCERCPLTARCRVFTLGEAIRRGDDVNAAFWSAFDADTAAQLEAAGAMRPAPVDDEEDADDWSASLKPDDVETAPRADDGGDDGDGDGDDRADDPFDRVERDPLPRAAMDYAMRMRTWLSRRGARDAPRRARESRKPADQSGSGPTASGPRAPVDDALDILGWYSLQIGVKLTRAMSGQHSLDADADAALGDDSRSDEFDDAHDDPMTGTTPTARTMSLGTDRNCRPRRCARRCATPAVPTATARRRSR